MSERYKDNNDKTIEKGNMAKSYSRLLEEQIAGMREELKRDDVRPEYKERNKVLINYFLDLVQTVDNDNLMKN